MMRCLSIAIRRNVRHAASIARETRASRRARLCCVVCSLRVETRRPRHGLTSRLVSCMVRGLCFTRMVYRPKPARVRMTRRSRRRRLLPRLRIHRWQLHRSPRRAQRRNLPRLELPHLPHLRSRERSVVPARPSRLLLRRLLLLLNLTRRPMPPLSKRCRGRTRWTSIC